MNDVLLRVVDRLMTSEVWPSFHGCLKLLVGPAMTGTSASLVMTTLTFKELGTDQEIHTLTMFDGGTGSVAPGTRWYALDG